jgi:hypothetical protein
MNLNQYFEMVELATKHGVQPGESMEKEFEEIRKKYDIKYIGTTDKDIDILTGDLRESGKKVLNLNEEERKRKNNGEK